MPVSTSDGRYYEDEHDYHHERLFGPQEEDAKGEGKMFLVRHGDTNCNDDGEVHGWVDEPLNEKGIEQAHKAAESLKDKKVTRIFSSDLPRAKQTANILAKELGVEVQFNPNLRTWDAGDFDYTNKHKEFEEYTQPTQRVYRDSDLPNTLKQPVDTFDNRFRGEPGKLPMQVPGESFSDDREGYGTQHAGRYTLKDEYIRPVWPNETGRMLQKLPYYPDAKAQYGKMENM